MGQKFTQGIINHLTWLMVDATDFATPESALSAATKIKIYGTLNGNSTAAFFVSSGTGSLTKDIQHVGASALGLYTLPLAVADLSDASAAFYDTYIVSLSATGAAYQTLIIDGERTDTSYLSNVLSYLSDIVSNINSQLVAGTFALGASNLSDIGSRVWADTIGARVDSRVLLNQSRISDTYSMLSDFYSDFGSRVPKAVATNSQVSDLASDLKSYLLIMSGVQSDVYSLLTAGVTLTTSAISDIGSRVWGEKYHAHSAASSFGSLFSVMATNDAAGSSRALLNQSRISDVYSMLSDLQSDFQSRVPKAVATNSQLSDVSSDLRSLLGLGVALDASTMSDIRSAITAGAPIQASDMSDLRSAITAVTATLSASDMSDLRSAILVGPTDVQLNASSLSDIRSAITAGAPIQASDMSDLRSAITAVTATLSASDMSDLRSAILAGPTDVQLNASSLSDLRSAITAITATVSASDISDIASAVWANTIGARVDSRVLVVKSQASDVYSLVAAGVSLDASTMSDIRSAINAGTATLSASDLSDLRSAILVGPTDVQLNASSLSDIRSAITAQTLTVSASDISDIASAVWANTIGARVDSRVLVIKSQASDIYSLMAAGVALDASTMSDIRSAVTAGAPIQASDMSDLRSAILAGPTDVQLNASSLSDIRSAVTAQPAITASDISDIASAVWANTIGARVDSRVLVIQSQTSDIYSLLSDVQSDLQSDLSSIQSDLTAIKAKTANLPEGIQKNTALANFEFLMVLTSDHVTPGTGLTVSAARSIDGGAFAACTNSATEVSGGIYKINLAAADTNGDFITLKFTAATADGTLISFKTEA